MNLLSKFHFTLPDIAITEETVEHAVLGCLIVEYLWTSYLIFRQHRKTKNTTAIPGEISSLMSPAAFQKGRFYVLKRLKYNFVKNTYQLAFTLTLIHDRFFAKLWTHAETLKRFGKDELHVTLVWVFLYTSILFVANLPFKVYKKFNLEKRHGYENPSLISFIFEQINYFVVSQIIYSGTAAVVVLTIKQRGGKNFFAYLWLVLSAVGLLLYVLYPTMILTLFQRYTVLPEGELNDQINDLSKKLNLPLRKSYLVQASKKINHDYLFLYGFNRSKRLIIYDSLFNSEINCSNDQILGIFSHEAGHWYYKHVQQLIFFLELNLFATLFILGWLYETKTPFEAFGFYTRRQRKCCKCSILHIPVFMKFFITWQYLMIPYNNLVDFFMRYVSRRCEFQADAFAKRLGKSESLIEALIKLHRDNLQFPVYDQWYSAWNYYHPHLIERVYELRR